MNLSAIFLSLLAAKSAANAFVTQGGHSSVSLKLSTSSVTKIPFTTINTRLSMAGRTGAPDVKKRKPTLTNETTWRLRLLLNDVTSTKGRKLDGQLFVIEGNFIEEEGYEPPQGIFTPIRKQQSKGDNDTEASGGDNGNRMALEVTSSRWKLSEDPNDPKDGLWVWGLFKEPLYPFMLLQIETNELKLPSSNDRECSGDADSIPPLKLYAQITHVRNEDVGVELKTANLNVRVLERVQLPGASVDLYEEEAVGQVSFQPL